MDKTFKKAGDNAHFENGFRAGIEFAQQWIPLPVNREIQPFKTILLKEKNVVTTGFLDENRNIIPHLVDLTQFNFTHYRLIEIE